MNDINWDNWESDLQKSTAEREHFFKSQSHKYFKREGTPGHYKYYYTEAEWKEAHGKKDDKKESGDKQEAIPKKVTIGESEWAFDDKMMNSLSNSDRAFVIDPNKQRSPVNRFPEDFKKVKLEPGGKYSITQFANSLGKVSTDSAKRKFEREVEKGRYNYTERKSFTNEDFKILDLAIGDNYNIFNYFNKKYDPSDIQVKSLGKITKQVASSNIYDKMAAPQYSATEISFKVRRRIGEEPMTISTKILSNSSLSMRDIVNFL